MPKLPPPRITFGRGPPAVPPKSPVAVTHAGIAPPVQAKAPVAPARAMIALPPVRFGGTLQPASAPIRRAGPPPPPTAFGSPPSSAQAKALGAPVRAGFAPPLIRYGGLGKLQSGWIRVRLLRPTLRPFRCPNGSGVQDQHYYRIRPAVAGYRGAIRRRVYRRLAKRRPGRLRQCYRRKDL